MSETEASPRTSETRDPKSQLETRGPGETLRVRRSWVYTVLYIGFLPALLALTVACWALWIYPLQMQDRAVRFYEELGGEVESDPTICFELFDTPREISLAGRSISDADMHLLPACSKLELLLLRNTRITDGAMRDIGQAYSLKSPHLDKADITGEGLRYLRNLSELETLSLAGMNVSGQELATLRSLGKLE